MVNLIKSVEYIFLCLRSLELLIIKLPYIFVIVKEEAAQYVDGQDL